MCPCPRLAIWHHLGDDAPLLSRTRLQGLGIEQKRLGSAGTGPITPGGEDAVARNDAAREMRQIIEGRAFASDNRVREQRILRMNIGVAFDGRYHRHPDIRQVFENLDALVVHLTPNVRIGDVAKGLKVKAGDEFTTGSREDDDLVVAILSDPVESIDEIC